MEYPIKNKAITALLDIYAKSLYELMHELEDIDTAMLIEIVDKVTTNKECQSIQTLLSHLVQSGYTYAIEIRKWMGEEELNYRELTLLDTIQAYKQALLKMFSYTEKVFWDYPGIQLTTYNPENKIKVRWGQYYDVEQLLQHGIVHILRHRRQITQFKQLLCH